MILRRVVRHNNCKWQMECSLYRLVFRNWFFLYLGVGQGAHGESSWSHTIWGKNNQKV